MNRERRPRSGGRAGKGEERPRIPLFFCHDASRRVRHSPRVPGALGEVAMAFAPPRSPFSPGHDAEGPVRGRLARAAVGSAADASADDPGGDDGDGNALRGGKPLWLVASDDAPTSPGATTVAAVTRSPGASRAPRPRSERADASKGPAFAHLLRQSEHLMKRLEAAHGALAQAFGGGKQTTYMTTQLRLKHGASALKSVSEALPIGDALLNNWDAAWGSQMHHVLRAKDQAESDLERMRRHTEKTVADQRDRHLVAKRDFVGLVFHRTGIRIDQDVDLHRHYLYRHQRMIAFCACRRFSASSQTSEVGPSMISASTSSPRCAGRQCRNLAPPWASSTFDALWLKKKGTCFQSKAIGVSRISFRGLGVEVIRVFTERVAAKAR